MYYLSLKIKKIRSFITFNSINLKKRINLLKRVNLKNSAKKIIKKKNFIIKSEEKGRRIK